MSKSRLFDDDSFVAFELKIKDYLNNYRDYITASTAKSTRAVGDAVQDILSEKFADLLGPEICAKYSTDFARRAMADLAFEDTSGCYYIVDVKTHRLSTKFNMPNLTSVERLAKFYEDEKDYFVVLIVAYEVSGMNVKVEKVTFAPIEFLSWECLTVRALGWGQIQIANSNRILIKPRYSRKLWMIELCDTLLEFYPREILKIDKRIQYFQIVKERWIDRPE
jgi:hypothetical protein